MLIGRTVGVDGPIRLHFDVLVVEPAGTLHTYMEDPLDSGYESSKGKAQPTPCLTIVESS